MFEKKEVAIVPLYTFDQLDEKIRQRIISDSRARFAEGIDYDYDISSFIVKAEDKGLCVKEEDIRFSLGGMQGDGASFVTKNFNFRKIIEDNGFIEKFPFLQDKQNLEDILDGLEGSIYRVEKTYPHKYTVLADVSYYGDLDDVGIEIASALEQTISDIKNDLCDTLYENLQATYDNELSDENICAFYQGSNDRFFVDGSYANPEFFDYSEEAKQAKAFMALPQAQRENIGALIDQESYRLVNSNGR